MKNITIKGDDPRLEAAAENHLFASLVGRDVLHIFGITRGYMNTDALCGVMRGYNRFPSGEFTYKVCGKCLAKVAG